MLEIEALNPPARRFQDQIDHTRWALYAMDPRIKCEHVTNNMIESLNHILLEPKGRTYLAMMEEIRKIVMQKMVERS